MEANSKCSTIDAANASTSKGKPPDATDGWTRRRVKRIMAEKGFSIGHCIGEGAYSKVFYAEYRQPSGGTAGATTFRALACKLIDRRKSSKEHERTMPRETVAMLALNHPHIVSVYSIHEHGPFLCVFMEYCRGGDLLQYLQQYGHLSESLARLFFWQLASAVGYMHTKGFCHRDIKCENVLMANMRWLKLTDFSFSKRCGTGSDTAALSATFCGSIAYAAPEILRGIRYEPKAYDMWSLGCVLFIMVTGTMPFDERNILETISRQERKEYHYPVGLKINLSIIELIDSLIEPDVGKRAAVGQVLAHPWLRDGDPGEANDSRPVLPRHG